MNRNQEQNWQTHEEIDRALDLALAKYAAAEPRTGLEERVLASLHAELEHARDHAWGRWGVVAVFATIVLVVLGLAWITMRPAPAIARRPPSLAPSAESPTPQTAPTRPPARGPAAKAVAHRSRPAAPAYPKLDQFPSPQPLSDQERILANYVEANPHHAVLLARARAEALHRDQIEETRSYSQDDGALKADDQNEDRNDR
jgi:hypothetical protein